MKKYLYSSILLLSFLLTGVGFAQILPPTLLSPPNNDTTVSLTVTLDWTDVSGASGYQVQVFRVSDGVKVLDTTITPSNFPVPSGIFTVNTWYSWHVRTWSGSQYSSWTGYWTFRTLGSAPPNPPILVSPPNNSTGQPLNLTFVWRKVFGATYYHLQVCTTNTFTGTLAIDANGLTDSQFVATNQLSNNTLYYWRVNANNQGGPGPWSTIWSFTTIVAPPAPPNLLSPPNGSQNQTNTPTLCWSSVPAALYYHVKVYSDPGGNTLVFDTNHVTGTCVTIPAGFLWGNQWFYWKVASGNGAGEGNYSVMWSFKTLTGPPPPPILTSPVSGSTCISRFPTLSWNSVGSGATYSIQVSWDINFAYGNMQINVGGWTNTSYTITSNVLQNATKYYWRINATNIGGTGPWSQIWNFTVIPLPPTAPTLVFPPNNATGVSLTPMFDWIAGTNAQKYQIQVALNSNFYPAIIDYTTPDTATHFQPQPGVLQGGTTYYWRVRTVNCSTQFSSWTPTWNFTTQVTLTANLKVYLEGFYNGSSQVMDTVDVILANSTTPYAFRDSSQVFLSSNGTGSVSFQNAPNGSYYIVIKHRNHLETWSAAAIPFAFGNPVNYDFTTSSNKAYGNNMKQVGSAWVLYGGDATQDGNIDNDDYQLSITQFGKDGYIGCDFNGDNFADGYDLLILYSNFFKSKIRP